jgi:hypothetical protein
MKHFYWMQRLKCKPVRHQLFFLLFHLSLSLSQPLLVNHLINLHHLTCLEPMTSRTLDLGWVTEFSVAHRNGKTYFDLQNNAFTFKLFPLFYWIFISFRRCRYSYFVNKLNNTRDTKHICSSIETSTKTNNKPFDYLHHSFNHSFTTIKYHAVTSFEITDVIKSLKKERFSWLRWHSGKNTNTKFSVHYFSANLYKQ